MKGSDIRASFLDFFEARGHRVAASAPLVPQSDPTLLFTNAGMVPFKNFFQGTSVPPHPRLATTQKCLRVSGKHNDLENVGPSSRHHTFFEMLGNFSFGDYFKAEAIELAWDLVTAVWEMNPEHIFATVYEEDDEAFDLWLRLSTLPEQRIVRCGKEDNFWAMGDTGPCGPNSELHIDRFPELPQVPWKEGSESGRYFEFWNLVFMQFDCGEDGELRPLPAPSIDTGAGLERVTALMQQVHSNYDTDLFRPLLEAAAELAAVSYGEDDASDLSLRVVVDHLRAVGFLLADGVIPGNEGRGYVLRRILRRAVRHGLRLGLEEPFFHRLLPQLAEVMSVYPELAATEEASVATVKAEEEKFLSTVAAGERHVQDVVEQARGEGRSQLRGDEAFRLYDTFGLPVEMIREILEEEGLTLDEVGFEESLSDQRARSRTATSRRQGQMSSLRAALLDGDELEATLFDGYDKLEIEGARALRIARADAERFRVADTLRAGEKGVVLFDQTVFYAESGGQVGDTGVGHWADGRLLVSDTQKDAAGLFYHWVEIVEGELSGASRVRLCVDELRRRQTERHHTATHLLQAALRQQLGPRVRQAGSLVHPERLRFDFTLDRPLEVAEREAVEDLVSEWVRQAVPTQIDERSYEEAIDLGAMALFGEKYGDVVRTVGVPGFSLELCGGCHVRNTGQIGAFRIVGERGVASGVRRIEAVSGDIAEALARQEHQLVGRVTEELAVPAERAVEEIATLKTRLKETQRELQRLRLERVSGPAQEAAGEVEILGVKVLTKEVGVAPPGELRAMADALRQRLGSGVVVLGAGEEEKVVLVVTVTPDLEQRVNAGALAKSLGGLVGGNGGGRRDFAQAGGKDPSLLPAALDAVAGAVEEQLREGAG